MALTELLFSDYNHYRRSCRNMAAVAKKIGHMPPDLIATPERLDALRGMAQWCIERRLDPPLWLFTLFQARVWMYPPRLDRLTPERHIVRYQKAQQLGFYERRQRGRRQAKKDAADDLYDPNRDLSPAIEAIKDTYQRTGCSKLCLESLHTETLGFHPKSKVCAACPLKSSCLVMIKKSVPFDILSLREGHITAAAARAQAERHWQKQLNPNFVPPPIAKPVTHGQYRIC